MMADTSLVLLTQKEMQVLAFELGCEMYEQIHGLKGGIVAKGTMMEQLSNVKQIAERYCYIVETLEEAKKKESEKPVDEG